MTTAMGDRIEGGGGQGRITSAERASLLVLIRQRERVAKADVQERAAVMLADFERKLAAIYYTEDHPAWKAAHEAAKAAVADARQRVAEVCRDLGIPKAFAPDLSAGWYGRGANASAERRAELRRVAKAEIDVSVKKGQAAIARASVEFQTRIVSAGLTSEAAHALLTELPKPEQLLPPIDLQSLERIAGPFKDRYGQPLLSTEAASAD